MVHRQGLALQQAGDPAARRPAAGELRPVGDPATADVGRGVSVFRRGGEGVARALTAPPRRGRGRGEEESRRHAGRGEGQGRHQDGFHPVGGDHDDHAGRFARRHGAGLHGGGAGDRGRADHGGGLWRGGADREGR